MEICLPQDFPQFFAHFPNTSPQSCTPGVRMQRKLAQLCLNLEVNPSAIFYTTPPKLTKL